MGRVSDAKERLIQAAIDLIWNRSYGVVTIDAICERALVKKGSFYYFFDSKSDLALAALEALWNSLRLELEGVFAGDVPPLERIQRYLDLIYRRQTELKEKFGHVLGCPFGSLGSELSREEHCLCEKVRSIMNCMPAYLEATFRDAIAQGLVPSFDPGAKAQAVFAYLEGLFLQARIQDDLSLFSTASASVFEMIGVAIPARSQ